MSEKIMYGINATCSKYTLLKKVSILSNMDTLQKKN